MEIIIYILMGMIALAGIHLLVNFLKVIVYIMAFILIVVIAIHTGMASFSGFHVKHWELERADKVERLIDDPNFHVLKDRYNKELAEYQEYTNHWLLKFYYSSKFNDIEFIQ
jgi:hypothetical protein